jgi:hypothetical protein
MAQTCCEALGQLNKLDPLRITNIVLTTIQHSLVANAVVLYARATSTHSDNGERGSISIDSRLTETDLIDHRILIDLRNRVIAHVHADEAVGDSVWHQERMILRADGLAGCATRRVQVDPGTVARLRRLIPLASNLVRDTFHKRIGRLTTALNEIGISISLLEQCPFDAIEFFGSEKGAKDGLSPGPGESALGIA